jgi:hypothetical protein
MFDGIEHTDNKSAWVKEEYFAKGSKGLRDFVKKSNLKAGTFADWIMNHRKFLLSIKDATLGIEQGHNRFLTTLQKFDDLLPGSSFKDIYFLIGMGKYGGTVTGSGFIIEAQKNIGGQGDPDYSEFNSLPFSASFDDLDQSIAHEQTHVARSHSYHESLACIALDEGIADYVAFLVTGKQGNGPTYQYGTTNELALKSEFIQDLEKDFDEIQHKWLWNWGETMSDRPPDLAYFIGFQIARSFAEGHENRSTAFKIMLSDYDCLEFIDESRYFSK